MQSFDVIIIGAGVAGSSAAYHLARSQKVLLLEQFEFLHKQGSSHGGSRIFRHAYPDPRYTKLAIAADGAWQELELESGEKLLHRTGGLDIGDRAVLEPIAESLTLAGSEFEWMDADDVRSRFPAFAPRPDQVILYQRNAAVLPATRAVATLQRIAAKFGALLQDREPVTQIRYPAGGVEVQTSKGEYRAEKLVITAGPWLSQLLTELQIPTQILQQQVLYLRVNPDQHHAASFSTGEMPLFINRDNRIYGLPVFEVPTAIKVSAHYHAPAITLEDRNFELNKEIATKTIAGTRELMPKVTSELVTYETCLYTMTPDEHFILDRHPHYDQVVIAGGFSGHGFKFGGITGRLIADLCLEGRSPFDLSLFQIDRLALQPAA